MPSSRIAGENEHALWVREDYPVSPGHSLVISKRHVGSFFETSSAERLDLLELPDQAKALVQAEHQPAGFNIGINDGTAAG